MIVLNEHILSMQQENETEGMSNLVLNRIRLLSRRRIEWLRKIWTQASENGSSEFNAHTEVDGYLFDRDILYQENEWFDTDPLMKQLSYSLKETEQALFNDSDSRLNMLATVFGLNRLETDILHICFALSIDPNLGRVFAYLQDHTGKGYITEPLVAKLFGYGHCIVLPADSPLKIWGLIKETIVQPGESPRMDCDPFIKNWISGFDGIDESLISFAKIQPVKGPLLNWPVQKLADDVRRMVNDEVQNRLRIFIEGVEGSGRRSFAAIVCNRIGMPLLSINADRIPENRWQHIYMLAQRQAFLSNISLLWYGASMEERYWPVNIPSCYVQFIVSESGSLPVRGEGFEDLHVNLPAISFDERLALWRRHVPLSAAWPKAETEEMVLRYDTTVGQIISIGQKMIPAITEVYEALRAGSGKRLGNLAQQMNSSFTFDDLVVPDYTRKAIEDFIFEATERVQFWEQPNAKRLFPQGRSLIGLFTGSPGTGKTMAAQVIASSLKLDLFRIDLSTVVSKYIGESSKNIERILSRAKNMNIVLLFDEADSLFGKRTEIKDAHDRYANTDTNYLLQAIESYPGIVVLASNKKSNIDSGFTRRMRYIVEFGKPDAGCRFQIWKKIISEMADKKTADRLDHELLKLSGLADVTGAQIKQAILSAIFMARRDKSDITISYLVRGVERELAKEGKGIGKQAHQSFNP